MISRDAKANSYMKSHRVMLRWNGAEIFGFPSRNRNTVESLVSSSTRFRECEESPASRNILFIYACMYENYVCKR